jgi:hypothetical protein
LFRLNRLGPPTVLRNPYLSIVVAKPSMAPHPQTTQLVPQSHTRSFPAALNRARLRLH